MTSWQLSGFAEERELGSGGSGRVVLARHEATGNEVAVKYLAAWLAADAAHLENFRTEAHLMAGLVDPHLVTLYEYVETTAGAAIVMDLLEGVALRKMLEDGGPLSPEAALTLMKGSLLGLAALHAQGVVHRDYKPENVMVDASGNTKLVDYGIAAPVGEIAGVSGTPLYMAPEQWRGEPSNAATDVYAATATFVECLTGHPMFTGSTVGALLQQHLTIPPPLDEVPEAVRPIAVAGLAKDPAERLGDAQALVARLDVLAPAAYGPDWERHGRAHLAARAVLLALLFAHPERVANEQASAQTDLSNGGSQGSGAGRAAGEGSGPGEGPGPGGVAGAGLAAAVAAGTAAAGAAERRRHRRPLTLVLGALLIAAAALALSRHAASSPRSSNAAFENRQVTSPASTPSASPTTSPSATSTPSATPTPTTSPSAEPTFSSSPDVTPTITPTATPSVVPPSSAPPTSTGVTKPPPTSAAPTTDPPTTLPPVLTNKQPVTSPSPPPPTFTLPVNCPPTTVCRSG
ncbi:MAG TPA: serine/threonine-protein kinase [Frankiaceae bacterium]|nr:serine/threonine-protein kinase [Frankiaceae bacterium]